MNEKVVRTGKKRFLRTFPLHEQFPVLQGLRMEPVFLRCGHTIGRLDGFNLFLLGSNSQDCFLSPFSNTLI